MFLRTFDQQVDFSGGKAGDLDCEAQVDLGEVAEDLAEQLIIPDGNLRETIVPDLEGTNLWFGQMVDGDSRYLRPAKALRCRYALMSSDDLVLAVNQHRDVEAELRDAVRDRADLRGLWTRGFRGSERRSPIGWLITVRGTEDKGEVVDLKCLAMSRPFHAAAIAANSAASAGSLVGRYRGKGGVKD